MDSDDDDDAERNCGEVTYHDNYDSSVHQHAEDSSTSISENKIRVKVSSFIPIVGQQSQQRVDVSLLAYNCEATTDTDTRDTEVYLASSVLESKQVMIVCDNIDHLSLDKSIPWDEIELKPSGMGSRLKQRKDESSGAGGTRFNSEKVNDVSLAPIIDGAARSSDIDTTLRAENTSVDLPLVSQQLLLQEALDRQSSMKSSNHHKLSASDHASQVADIVALKTTKLESISTAVQSDNNNISSAKRIKPLKRNDRKLKGLNFFGVSTAKTKVSSAMTTAARISIPSESSITSTSSLGSTDHAAAPSDTKRTTAEFFGPIGIFGDDMYSRDDHVSDELVVDTDTAMSRSVTIPDPATSTSSTPSAISSVQDSFRVFIRVSASSNNFIGLLV